MRDRALFVDGGRSRAVRAAVGRLPAALRGHVTLLGLDPARVVELGPPSQPAPLPEPRGDERATPLLRLDVSVPPPLLDLALASLRRTLAHRSSPVVVIARLASGRPPSPRQLLAIAAAGFVPGAELGGFDPIAGSTLYASPGGLVDYPLPTRRISRQVAEAIVHSRDFVPGCWGDAVIERIARGIDRSTPERWRAALLNHYLHVTVQELLAARAPAPPTPPTRPTRPTPPTRPGANASTEGTLASQLPG